MGELLDRNFQRDILRQLSELYPRQADVERSWGSQSDNRLLVNMFYLNEHELIELNSKTYMDGQIRLHSATITAKGLDFIADDGGLSAILGVVTVKLHQDTVRELLVAKISSVNAPDTTKEHLIARIRGLPAEALGNLTQKALDAGLSSIPNFAVWLTNALSG